MWIEITKDVFEESDFKGLNYLFQILSWYPNNIPRYNVFIDFENVEDTENYSKLKGAEIKFDDFIISQFDYFVQSSPRGKLKDFYVSNKRDTKHFNIAEAIRFFSQPVSIILENNKNDSYFIKAIIYHFDYSGILKEHVHNGWIKFENAGGCSNVHNFIEGELKSYEELASRNVRNTFQYYRGLVILDSDKEYSTQTVKMQYQNLLNYLNLKTIPFHILEKRMMENYMPNEVIDEIETTLTNSALDNELRLWINVYKHLSDEQKDYLKYYDGFNREFLDLDVNVQTLYQNQVPTNFEILKKGFKYRSRENIDGEESNEFKNAFPKKFITSNVVNPQTLSNRVNSNELLDILNKINQLI